MKCNATIQKQTQPLQQHADIHMDPSKIRNNGDLMNYWSGIHGRPWRNITEEDKTQQRLTDQWNQFTSDHACPRYISMNFNKDGSRKQKSKTEVKNLAIVSAVMSALIART